MWPYSCIDEVPESVQLLADMFFDFDFAYYNAFDESTYISTSSSSDSLECSIRHYYES